MGLSAPATASLLLMLSPLLALLPPLSRPDLSAAGRASYSRRAPGSRSLSRTSARATRCLTAASRCRASQGTRLAVGEPDNWPGTRSFPDLKGC